MERLGNGVHQISMGYVNAFLIDGDEGVVIVDTGLPKKLGEIETVLGSIGRALDDVTAIVLTHSHTDHVGSAAALKQRTQARLIASRKAAPVVRGERKPPPPPVLSGLLRPLARLMPAPDPVDVDVEVDAQSQSLPSDLEVIETPGHTSGHVCYLLDRDGGILFVGDAAVSTKDGRVAKGWMNRRSPDWDGSIGHIAEREFSQACFGHAGPITSEGSEAFRSFAASL